MIPKIIQAVKNQNVFLNTDNITISGDGTLENPISVILDNVRIELRESSEYIQWRYIGSSSWNNLVALSEITGPQGDKGDTGKYITEIDFVLNDMVFTFNDASIVSITDAKLTLKGDQGIQGERGLQGIQGIQGIQGVQGVQGPQGKYITDVSFSGNDMLFTFNDLSTEIIVDAKTTLIGPQGIQGIQGIRGLQGVAGYTPVKGVDYFDGEKGQKGDTGLTGATGSPGKYIVDAVFAGNDIMFIFNDASTEVLVDAKLTLKGPQGIQGEHGTNGTNGYTPIKGIDYFDGNDGREVELQKTATYIQWRYVGETSWTNLIAISDLKGDKGETGSKGDAGYTPIKNVDYFDGTNGTDGKSVEIQNNGTYIQWRLIGDLSWINIVALSALKGDKGETGAKIISGAFVSNDMVFTLDDSSTATIINAKIDLKGEKGDKGDKGDTGSTTLDRPFSIAMAIALG